MPRIPAYNVSPNEIVHPVPGKLVECLAKVFIVIMLLIYLEFGMIEVSFILFYKKNFCRSPGSDCEQCDNSCHHLLDHHTFHFVAYH